MSDFTGSQRLEAMQTLLEEIVDIQREKNRSEEVMERVKGIVEESSKIVENSEIPHEMVLDAKILQISSQLTRSNIRAFDTNLTSFDAEEYANGIVDYLESISLRPGWDENWDNLAETTSSMFKKTSPLTYILGTFVMDPPPKEKVRHERTKATEAQKRVLESCESQVEENDETSDVYQHILKCLVRVFKRNGRKPIGFYEFVIDPNHYWKTVENIFHLAFLVRDARVGMSLNYQGLPVIEPLAKKAELEEGGVKHNYQFNCRMTVGEWEEFISVFDITRAAIVPFSKD